MMLFNYVESDIPYKLAHNAHSGTSMVPERRAEQLIDSYMDEMKALDEEFQQYANDQNREEISADLERYKTGWLKRHNAYLAAQSRCLSILVAGPANFPTRRNQKRNATAQKRLEEFLAYRKKVLIKLRRTYNPQLVARAAISADRGDEAILALQQKIKAQEKCQEDMKAGNKIIRSKILTDDQKVAKLVELGFDEGSAHKALIPDYMGRIGFPKWQLSNNNANIRRMKQRVKSLQKELTRRGEQPAEDKEYTLTGGMTVTVSENTHENRLQLFFDGKPSPEIRTSLKSRGFRWARSQGAWQRQLNDNARRTVELLLNDWKED